MKSDNELMKCKSSRYNIGEKNPMFGKKHKPETILKMKRIKQKENNPNWRNIPSYNALHSWINRNLPKPELCDICNLVPPNDSANITGIYNRDFKNWKYLCRSCHMKSDGRINNLKQFKKVKSDA